MTGAVNFKLDDISTALERQRKEIPDKHIEELARSIHENGLLHAVIITPDGLLVAGFCRLMAVILLNEKKLSFYYDGEDIPTGFIPTIKTHKTTETDLFQIELEENVRRRNLSFIEQAQAVARLHRLKQELDPLWNQKETAQTLAEIRGKETKPTRTEEQEVADSLLLSEFADDPDVRAARTRGSAVRIASKKVEQQALAGLGIKTNLDGNRHKVIHGDATIEISKLSKGVFDAIITDPPYGIGADQFGSAGFLGTVHGYKDSQEFALSLYSLLARDGYWACAEQAHIFTFCDIRHFPKLAKTFTEHNWSVWPTPLIWYKGTTAHAPRPEHGPKRTYEAILFASKGDKKIVRLGQDLLDLSSVSRTTKIHPAEKPVELFEELLSWTLLPGMRVLDPFCGSGPVFEATDNLGGDATGIEIDENFASICKTRIEALK